MWGGPGVPQKRSRGRGGGVWWTGRGDGAGAGGRRRYAQLMEKLSAGTGRLLPGDAHILIDLSSWYKSSLSPKIEEIQAAIQQHHTIRFSYFSPKGKSIRTVEPYYQVIHWSTWYVWG